MKGPTRAFTSGVGTRRRWQSRRKRRSSSLRLRSTALPSSPIGSPLTSAWRIALPSSSRVATRRRSARVRAGVVTAMPSRMVVTAEVSNEERCRRMP